MTSTLVNLLISIIGGISFGTCYLAWVNARDISKMKKEIAYLESDSE